MTVVSTTH